MKLRLITTMLFAATLSSPAFALHEVYSPDIEKGEFEIEYYHARFGDSDNHELNNTQEHELEVSYSFTDNLNIGLAVEGERESEHPFHVTEYALRGIYQLTDQEEHWWLSSGVLGQYAYTRADKTPDELILKILLEREQGPWDFIVNLNTERGLGGRREPGVSVGSIFQVTRDVGHDVALGLEWSADWGTTANWSGNTGQYLGPIITGGIPLDTSHETGKIEYTLGYLQGLTDTSADYAVRFVIGYEVEL